MMYERRGDIEHFAKRLVSEQDAQNYVWAERRHCAAVRAAIDSTIDPYYPDLEQRDDDA